MQDGFLHLGLMPHLAGESILQVDSNVFIKDETVQPTGTWKDRRSRLIIERALAANVNHLVLITSGNAGYSLAHLAENTPLRVTIIVDQHLPEVIQQKLESVCDRVLRVDLNSKVLSSDEVISLARESADETIWDVTNGFEDAYASIIDELADLAPDVIFCPVGSGEAFVGLANAIEARSSTTKLIGVTPSSASSIADKLTTPWSPYTPRILELIATKHQLLRVSEEEIANAYNEAKTIINCEPSSAIVFAGFAQLKLSPDVRVVLINSGKGLL